MTIQAQNELLDLIRGALAPSTGCTEPSAIALNAAMARSAFRGPVQRMTVRTDPYLFKNAMGVGIPGADDIMLNYQSTSFHDAAYLRRILNRRPAPEFEAWLERMGILAPDGRLLPPGGALHALEADIQSSSPGVPS